MNSVQNLAFDIPAIAWTHEKWLRILRVLDDGINSRSGHLAFGKASRAWALVQSSWGYNNTERLRHPNLIVSDLNSQEISKVVKAFRDLEEIAQRLPEITRNSLENLLVGTRFNKQPKSVEGCLNLYPGLKVFRATPFLKEWIDASSSPEEQRSRLNVREQISLASVAKQNYLNIIGLGLQDLPPDEIERLPLGHLNLAYNKLKSIPALPPGLRRLFLHDNAFELLPDLSQYRLLSMLNIGGNKLEHLPDWILSMPRSAKVYAKDNPFPPGYTEEFQERLRRHREEHPEEGPLLIA